MERAVPVGKVIHAIADNYATPKHPKVLEWLAEHPRWTFHFTPTSASWLNADEGFFSRTPPSRVLDFGRVTMLQPAASSRAHHA